MEEVESFQNGKHGLPRHHARLTNFKREMGVCGSVLLLAVSGAGLGLAGVADANGALVARGDSHAAGGDAHVARGASGGVPWGHEARSLGLPGGAATTGPPDRRGLPSGPPDGHSLGSGRSGLPGLDSGHPGGPGSDPGHPGLPGLDSGHPGGPGSDPGHPGGPGPAPGQPGGPGSVSGQPGTPGSGFGSSSGQPPGEGSGSGLDTGGSDQPGGHARGGGAQSTHGRRGNGNGGSSGQGGGARAASGRCEGTCRSTGGLSLVPGVPVYTPPSPTPIIQIPSPTPIVSVPTPHPVTSPSQESTSVSEPKIVAGSPGGAGSLVQGLGTAPSTSLRFFTQALADATTPAGPLVAQTATASKGSGHSTAQGTTVRSFSHKPIPTPPSTNEFERIERVVPSAVWIALAVSLALVAVTGTAALWSGFRMRRQGVRLQLISAAALTDPLTGVLNRRGFTEAAERELARARRHHRPFTLAYIDVRNLKAVNDSEGHRAGDGVLRATARLLRDAARADDLVGRIGGDEMAMMLVEQDAGGAEVVKQRIAERIAALRAEMGLRAPWDLTIGTAVYPEDGQSVDDLLRTADTRLYQQRGIALS